MAYSLKSFLHINHRQPSPSPSPSNFVTRVSVRASWCAALGGGGARPPPPAAGRAEHQDALTDSRVTKLLGLGLGLGCL
jgi:hypothetical protein